MKTSIIGLISILLFPPGSILADVRIHIDLTAESRPIRPFIYGVNQDLGLSIWKSRRLGGNRMTGYNWETNASNAGADWYHSSDNYMLYNSEYPPERITKVIANPRIERTEPYPVMAF
jgi:hypothetical protein